MKKIVIGDSHSQLFANNPQFRRGMWSDASLENEFDVRWMGPVTYWRLFRDQRNFIDFTKDLRYDPFPGMEISTFAEIGSEILITLGEIDIRSNIMNHNSGDYSKTIDIMSNGIYDYISDYKGRFEINICSISPPIKELDCNSSNSEFPFVGTDEQRMNATIHFNNQLKKICDSTNSRYFDIYPIYEKNGMLDPEKSDNIVHCIKTWELENKIKNHFGI
jgi:hypothetical protein